MENNNRAVIYARVSSTTERQSTERQVSDLEVLVKSRNMRIEKIYEEKISGAKKNSERAVLTECLEYCFSEGIGTLLISELSRLGRNVDEVLKNVMLCKEKRLNSRKRTSAYSTPRVKSIPSLPSSSLSLELWLRWRERISASVYNRGKHSISPREAR